MMPRRFVVAPIAFVLVVAVSFAAHGQEELKRSFQARAEKIIANFTAATDGVRNIKIDLRRRDMVPDADVQMVGVLGFDMKPKGGAWHSVRLLYGRRNGAWDFLQALHEIQSEHPAWTEGGAWYRGIAEGHTAANQ
jgi:hypothetical protein